MTTPALYGIGQVRDMRAIALDLRHQAARTAIAGGRLSRQVAELDRHQRAYVATADPGLALHVRHALDAIEAQADSLAASGYGEMLAAKLPVQALRASADSLRTLVETGALEAATTHLALVALPLLGSVDTAMLQLSAQIDRNTAARVAEADRISSAAVTTTAAAILLALLAASLLAWLAARLLTRPLERLSGAMGTVAGGRLDTPADPALDRDDEVGELFRSFQSMAWQLVQLDRMKAELVGMASHDLKTPISVITGYAELLDESEAVFDDHHRQVIAALHGQARALGGRVDQLIEISRMEARGLRLGLEEINIRHFAMGIETAFASMAHRHGLDLAVSVASDAPTFIIADPDCLRADVVGKIVEHSVKFSPRGAIVRVGFQGGEGRLRIEVRDQGPPVPPHLASHLFDRYYRGPPASGRVGSGVALPIARAGVEAHGGSIHVTSDVDGTSFLVDLPLRPGAFSPGQTVPAL